MKVLSNTLAIALYLRSLEKTIYISGHESCSHAVGSEYMLSFVVSITKTLHYLPSHNLKNRNDKTIEEIRFRAFD